MALSSELGKLGMTAESLDTKCTLTLDFIDGKPTITTSQLEVTARIAGADRDKFNEAARVAVLRCRYAISPGSRSYSKPGVTWP